MRRIAASEIENTPLKEEILIFKPSNSRDCCWGVIVVNGIEKFAIAAKNSVIATKIKPPHHFRKIEVNKFTS